MAYMCYHPVSLVSLLEKSLYIIIHSFFVVVDAVLNIG